MIDFDSTVSASVSLVWLLGEEEGCIWCCFSIRAGNNFHDLQEVELMDLNESSGWVVISLKDANDSPI
jgi:hypothetical protein